MKAFFGILLLILICIQIVKFVVERFCKGRLPEFWRQNETGIEDDEQRKNIQRKFKWYFGLYGFLIGVVVFILFTYSYSSMENVTKVWKCLSPKYVVVATIWWILMFPVGQLMGTFLKGYYEPKSYRGSGLERAGKLIGQLERTLVLIFYLGNSLSGIAFLVVAKSILRFSDLQEGHKEKNDSSENDKEGEGEEENDEEDENRGFAISEYIILGSFLSYTLAVLAGISVDLILKLQHYGFSY